MKKLPAALLISIIYLGCDPGYSVRIRNETTSPMYIKTAPSIESLYETGNIYYDSLLAIKTGQEGKLSVYKINPNYDLNLYDMLGFQPGLNYIPFDYLEFIKGNDTIILDSKEKILHQINPKSKKSRYYFNL